MIEIEELDAWDYLKERLLEILNDCYQLEEAREDIKSFRNTEHYRGTKEKYKLILEE